MGGYKSCFKDCGGWGLGNENILSKGGRGNERELDPHKLNESDLWRENTSGSTPNLIKIYKKVGRFAIKN